MKIEISTGSDPKRWEEQVVEKRQSNVSYRETPGDIELTIEMPGADAQGLSVSLRGRKLTVEHERKQETRNSDGDVERVETKTEKRTKEVELPIDVDPDRTDAVYQDGILKVTLGKRGAAPGAG